MTPKIFMTVSGGRGALSVLAVLLVFVALVSVSQDKYNAPADWGGDNFQYIMHAQAIIEGRAYQDIPYIYNPDRPWLGPRAYPPGLPLFLVVPVWIHGADSKFIPLYQFPIMAGIIVFTILVCRQYLPGYWPLLPGFFLAVHPYVVRPPPGLLSDPLFTLFLMAALYCGNEFLLKGKSFRVLNAVVLALLVLAVFATRTIGIVMFPALMLFAMLGYRRVDFRTAMLTLVLGGVAYILMTKMMGSPLHDYISATSNIDQHKQGMDFIHSALALLDRIILRLPEVPVAMSGAWIMEKTDSISIIFIGLCLVLVGVGFLINIFREIRLSDVVVVGYTAVLLISPYFISFRILFPLVPLVLIYLSCGIYFAGCIAGRWFASREFRMASNAERGVGALLVLPVLVMLATSHFSSGSGKIKRSPADPAAKAMVQYVDRNISRDAILVSSRPRTMHRLIGRVGSSPPWPLSEAESVAWMKRISAEYLLLIGEDFSAPPKMLRLVHSEGYLKLYKLS